MIVLVIASDPGVFGQALAVMPGVTREAILESKIGKKVRNVERRGSFQDSTIPSLATWVIQKLKSDVGAQPEGQSSSKRVNSKSEGDKEKHCAERALLDEVPQVLAVKTTNAMKGLLPRSQLASHASRMLGQAKERQRMVLVLPCNSPTRPATCST